MGYILRPGFDLPAMTFTYEQLDALAMGLSFVEAAGDMALSQAAAEVRAKLESALPDSKERRLEDAPMFASRQDGRAAPFGKVVRRAIRQSSVLSIRYKDRSGEQSERRVRPLAIWALTDGWLFAGWCELRADFRAFRLDRVTVIEDTGESFTSEPNQTLHAYLAAKFPNGQARALS